MLFSFFRYLSVNSPKFFSVMIFVSVTELTLTPTLTLTLNRPKNNSGELTDKYRGVFMVHKQEGYFLYVCTKFEADCSIRSKVNKGSQNFEIRSRDPKPRPF